MLVSTCLVCCCFTFRPIHASTTLVDGTNGYTIVAFGDSLTAGYWKQTRGQYEPFFHAYAIRLRDLLKNSSTIVEKGLSGERTGEMLHRLPNVLTVQPKIKLVIILGGTNDLGSGRVPNDEIVANIKQLHRIALNSSSLSPHQDVIYTIAVTIPQAVWMLKGPSAVKRLAINEKIRAFAGRCSARISVLDLENAFDLSVKANMNTFWSPDGLHLNPHGYDEFGEMIYKLMESTTIDDTKAFSLDCLSS